MIFEGIMGIFKDLLLGYISGIEFLQLPYDLIQFLGTVTGYGSFIVGSDILFYFYASVSFWLSIKIFVGSFVFLWRLLPFT